MILSWDEAVTDYGFHNEKTSNAPSSSSNHSPNQEKCLFRSLPETEVADRWNYEAISHQFCTYGTLWCRVIQSREITSHNNKLCARSRFISRAVATAHECQRSEYYCTIRHLGGLRLPRYVVSQGKITAQIANLLSGRIHLRLNFLFQLLVALSLGTYAHVFGDFPYVDLSALQLLFCRSP